MSCVQEFEHHLSLRRIGPSSRTALLRHFFFKTLLLYCFSYELEMSLRKPLHWLLLELEVHTEKKYKNKLSPTQNHKSNTFHMLWVIKKER